MSALTAPRAYVLLAAFQAGDAVVCALPLAAVTKGLDAVGLDPRLRPVLPIVKAASVVGLLAVSRFPTLARVTTLMLTVYFALAVAFHIRARDWSPGLVAASSLLAVVGTMTAKGPAVTRR